MLSETFEKQVLDKKPNGPLLLNGVPSINAKDPKALIDQVVQQELENTDVSSLRRAVSVTELKLDTSQNPSLADFRNEFVTAVTPFFSLTTNQDPTSTTFASFTTVADQTLAALKNLAIPSSLATLMAKEIELITYNRNIFAAVANAGSDPLHAMLAFKAWESARQEFEKAHLALMTKLSS